MAVKINVIIGWIDESRDRLKDLERVAPAWGEGKGLGWAGVKVVPKMWSRGEF